MDTFSKDEVNAKLEAVEAKVAAKLEVIAGRFEATAEYVRMQADRAWEAAEAAARSAEAAARSADKVEGIKLTVWISSLTTILSVLAIAIASYLGSQQSSIAIAQAVTEAYQVGAAERPVTPTPPAEPSGNPKR